MCDDGIVVFMAQMTSVAFVPGTLYRDIRAVLESARSSAYRAVNVAMLRALGRWPRGLFPWWRARILGAARTLLSFLTGSGRLVLTTPVTYRVRLRFRLQKKLKIDDNEHRLTVAGREVVLTPPTPEQKISESEWLIMNARGFAGEHEAREFGRRLRTALEVSAVAARVGVDVGRDLATSSLGRTVREEILKKSGADVRPNVHGLDVFPDDPNTRIFGVSMTGSVLASPDPFMSDLDELHKNAPALSQRVGDVILLLNYALMRPEPVAQIVFAVSAVESLGQDETWTDDQKKLLKELAAAAEQSTIGTAAERQEVAVAMKKSLHRLTLRQGVFRLLDRLGLAHLKEPWDDLYAERSTLVHGLAPKPGADYSTLAHRTVGLCGQILLKAVAAEIPLADRHVARFYAGGEAWSRHSP